MGNTSNAFQQQAAATPTASSSPFGSTPAVPKVNPFGSSSTDQTEKQDQSNQQTENKINPFASTKTNIFGSTNSKVDRENLVTGQNDSIIYSLLESLTKLEIVAFQSDEFTLENIPI